MIRFLIKKFLMIFSVFLYKNRKSKILYYHDVYDNIKYTEMGTHLDLFEKHIEIIRSNGFKITNEITNAENEVMICFDDGFRGIYDTREFFIEKGIKPVIFIAVTLIGKPGYLSKEEILELQNLGFKFQCHAWSHNDLTKYSKQDLVRELLESKNVLSEILNKPVEEICFPIGYFSLLVLEECERYGYTTMYSSVPGNFQDKLLDRNLRSRNLVQFSTSNEVRLILYGGNQLLHNRYIKMHFRD